MTIKVHIIPADKIPGKLADAELHFADGPLDGLKLIGFGIWERRGSLERSITFPARTYSVNGEKRTFGLLRSIHAEDASTPLRNLINAAYQEYFLGPVQPS